MEELLLRPRPVYWFIKYFIFITIMLAISISTLYINSRYYYTGAFALICILSIILFYTYVDMLIFTKWIINDNKIKIIKGVFHRKTDYIELYRIVDYSESQSFLQLIFKNKTVTIESGDKSHPVFSFYGISKNEPVIEFIRPRVEIQKRKIGVYEVTNR